MSNRRTFRGRMIRLAMSLAVGGSAFQLGGCDPAVRDALLTGLETTTQSLGSTLITAFFLSLDDGSSSSSSTNGLATT
ncbi:MAG: hypothetical protein J5J06_06990 [Phycisphaerae bacterium]|nr:hypothetical protein [Phycisphaerae bacterium]